MEKYSVDVWLWILLVMQPHNRRTNFILHNCGYDAIKAASQIRDGNLMFLSENEKRRAREVRMGEVRKLRQQCADNNVRIVPIDDEEYPELLRHIEDPPIVLFVAGDLKGLNERLCISAVGTRKASEYGVNVTKRICGALAERGIAIISGLAVGLDTAAHRACLNAGGKTVGVLGCGILVNYPADSAQLKRDIVNNGGAVISELLPNASSSRGYFHIRNRIISGMAHGTIVLEAGEKSGALLTANHAINQGRELFCIPPHDIFSRDFAGVIPLLRDGAVPVFGYDDVFNTFLLSVPEDGIASAPEEKLSRSVKSPKMPRMRRKSEPDNSEEVPENIPDKAAEISENTEIIENIEKGEQNSEQLSKLSELSELEAAIIKLLFEKSANEDTIIDKTGKDFAEISETLTTLEIMGLIVRNMDGTYKPQLES